MPHAPDVRGFGLAAGAPRLVDVSSHPSVEELCLASDALVTDYSSLMFDYATLDRPIVIHADDWEAYEAARGTYFDLRATPPGAIARTEDELVDIFATGHWQGSRSAQLRASFRSRFCSHDDGHAAERVVRRVFLGECVPTPPIVPLADRRPPRRRLPRRPRKPRRPRSWRGCGRSRRPGLGREARDHRAGQFVEVGARHGFAHDDLAPVQRPDRQVEGPRRVGPRGQFAPRDCLGDDALRHPPLPFQEGSAHGVREFRVPCRLDEQVGDHGGGDRVAQQVGHDLQQGPYVPVQRACRRRRNPSTAKAPTRSRTRCSLDFHRR